MSTVLHLELGNSMSAFSNELSLYDQEEYIEPELDDSVYNPANSQYRKVTHSLRRIIKHQAMQMRPKHAQIAKLVASGMQTNVQIAKRMRCAPNTVASVKKQPDAQRLIGAIRELKLLTDGTRAIDREMMLWGIALREEEIDPRTSIAAISEINRMKVDTPAAQAKLAQTADITNQPTIIIQLADSRLLPSPLDNPQLNLKDVN